MLAQRTPSDGLCACIERGANCLAWRVQQFGGEVRGKPRIGGGETIRRVQCERRQREPAAIRVRAHSAGAACDRAGARLRGGQQRREQPCFIPAERIGRLAEQAVGGSGDALRLAAERGHVEIGFEDLALAPPGLQRPGSADLAELGAQRAAARIAKLGREEGGDLHADRAGAAMPPARLRPQRSGERAPVDAIMPGEAAILGRDHVLPHRRRDAIERRPAEPLGLEVDPLGLEEPAVAIGEPGERRSPGGPCGGVGWEGRGKGPEIEGDEWKKEREAEKHSPLVGEGLFLSGHGALTASGAFGSAAWIAGEYSASTRVGGKPNLPAPLRRSA